MLDITAGYARGGDSPLCHDLDLSLLPERDSVFSGLPGLVYLVARQKDLPFIAP